MPETKDTLKQKLAKAINGLKAFIFSEPEKAAVVLKTAKLKEKFALSKPEGEHELTLADETKKTFKFSDYQLKDGTIITSDTDKIAEGSAMTVKIEDGTVVPVPDGSYEVTLEDETSATITIEAGFVTKIEPIVVEEVTVDMDNDGDMAAQFKTLQDQVAALAKEVAALKENNSKLNTDVAGSGTTIINLSKENEELKQAFALAKDAIALIGEQDSEVPKITERKRYAKPEEKEYKRRSTDFQAIRDLK